MATSQNPLTMNKQLKHSYLFFLLVIVGLAGCDSPEPLGDSSGEDSHVVSEEQVEHPILGANFNHQPEIIDFRYLEKSRTNWVRTTPYIFEYINGEKSASGDPGLGNVVEAGKRGYKVAFGYRWDFKKHDQRIPAPDSEREKHYFTIARQMLEEVGPYVQIFKLGNEPILETKRADMQPDPSGTIPLVRFMQRLKDQVVLPFYEDHPEIQLPAVFVGSIQALFDEEIQNIPATDGLIRFANDDNDITGLALHLHIADTTEIPQAFEYARAIMPEKPFIIPEFSLNRMYRKHMSEPLDATPAGKTFAERYNRDPKWKMYEWYSEANSNRVSPAEWNACLASRSWYPENYIKTYFRYYRRYGVVMASYPLLQQYCPNKVTANSAAWFLNPIFCQKSLTLDAQGNYSRNPLVFTDFTDMVALNNESIPTALEPK